MHPYWFYVTSDDESGNLPDFALRHDGFYFSQRLWELIGRVIEAECWVINESGDGGLEIIPTTEICCLNDIADPLPGEEIICLSQSSGNIAVAPELPGRLYVTDTIVSLVAGKGFSGIGFVELRDELDGRRPTFSFLRALPALRLEDPLLDAIAHFCSERRLNLTKFTLADENYVVEERIIRAVWFLVESTPFVSFFLDGRFVVCDETGRKLNTDAE